MSQFTGFYLSPLGALQITANEKFLKKIEFASNEDIIPKDNKIESDIIKNTIAQLEEYFLQSRREFDIPLEMEGTDFQKKVWKELLTIPFGYTISYAQLAKKIGDENAVRAVGSANGQNPIAIIVPCHRVIGSTGDLTGYSGELWRKQWLLEHEGGIRRLF
jgi:methylated-DNA-[protein]-cysteine S-methyltransferase